MAGTGPAHLFSFLFLLGSWYTPICTTLAHPRLSDFRRLTGPYYGNNQQKSSGPQDSHYRVKGFQGFVFLSCFVLFLMKRSPLSKGESAKLSCVPEIPVWVHHLLPHWDGLRTEGAFREGRVELTTLLNRHPQCLLSSTRSRLTTVSALGTGEVSSPKLAVSILPQGKGHHSSLGAWVSESQAQSKTDYVLFRGFP